MILLLGEGVSLSFDNSSTGDYAMINRYQHIFTKDFYLPDSELRPFGCLSSVSRSVRMVSYLRGHADFLSPPLDRSTSGDEGTKDCGVRMSQMVCTMYLCW